MVVFAEGEQVRAKFMATKMGPFGTKFLPGVISKVYPDPGKKHDMYRYDIDYENGKSEASVKAQFVKEPLAEAAGATAPTPKPVLAPEAKQPEPKSVQKEVKAVAAQATPVAKPEPKSAQKASAGPTDASSKRESKLTKASPDGSDSEFAAKPSKAAASAAAASSAGKTEASASSNKRVRKQVDYNAAEHSDDESSEDAAASKSPRAGASKGKASRPKKVVAESESEEYEEPSAEGSGDEESESEAEAESEPEEAPKKKPAKAAPKPAERKPAAKKAVAAPPKKTKKAASPEPDSDSEGASDEEEEEEEDDDAFDEEKAPVKKAAKARPAAKAKGSSSYEKSKWTEEEIAELPVLTKPQEMFDEMVAQAEARARTKGSALEGHSLAELAQRLEGRKLRVATMCSGTESPVLALDMISKSLFKQCGVQLEMDHVFSCEIEPFKQAYIERNFAPPTLFRDIRELDGEQASTASTTRYRSPLIPHPSPLTPHPSPLTVHPSPLTSPGDHGLRLAARRARRRGHPDRGHLVRRLLQHEHSAQGARGRQGRAEPDRTPCSRGCS